MWFIVLAAVSVLGLWLASWAFFGDPARGRRRCPNCWYDMSGTPGNLRCSECGHACKEERELRRPRRRRFLAVVGLLIGLAPGAWALVSTGIERGWHYAFLPTWKTTQEYRIGPFSAQVLEVRNPKSPTWTRQARITRDGETLFALDSFYPSIGQKLADGRTIGRGDDLTGNGIPDLIIRDDTGGTGCYGASYLIALDAKAPRSGFRVVATIDYCGRFEDVTGDGVVEFIAGDRTYAYKWTSGADSPQPEVILRLIDGRLAVAFDLMRVPAPTDEEIATRVAALRADRPADPFTVRLGRLLSEVLDLIHSGNEAQGWALLDAAWPGDAPDATDKDAFITELRAALRESPFAAEIEALNRADN